MKTKQYEVIDKDFDLSQMSTQPDQDLGDDRELKKQMQANIKPLKNLQKKLYANHTYGVLMVFQGMDAAGKDSLVAHMFAGVNPAGFQVASFKHPSHRELAHDYLWRVNLALPRRGVIGIFNRSYYEDLLVPQVHPEILLHENLPNINQLSDVNNEFFKQRFHDVVHYEHYLNHCGYLVLKFFLHMSKEEQKRRFLARIERPEKNWKFSPDDIKERQYWDLYQAAYEKMIRHTASEADPWYIIPGDDKWYERLAVSNILMKKLDALKLTYPKMNAEQTARLKEAMNRLDEEKD